MAYWRMKKQTEEYKKATGQSYKQVPNELIDIERQLNVVRAELEKMIADKEPEVVIGRKRVDLGVLEARYRRLVKEYNQP